MTNRTPPSPFELGSELRAMATRLRRAQEVAHVGSWELDLAHNIMWASEEAFRIYGLTPTPDLLLPLADAQSIPLREHRPALDAALAALIAGTGVYDIEFAIRRANDGAIRHVHSRALLTRDPQGRPWRVDGTLQDITERKRMQEALCTSEAKYRMLVEHAADGILLGRPSGEVFEANRRACELSGYAREELVGRPISVLFSAHELEVEPLRFDLLEAGDLVLRQREIRRRDGTLAPVEMCSRKLPDGTLQAILRDISERRQAERDLAAREEQYRTLFESSYDAVLITCSRVVVRCNRRSTVLLGMDAEQMVGRALTRLLAPLQPPGLADARELDRCLAAAEQGQTSLLRAMLRRADGSTFLGEIALAGLRIRGVDHVQANVRDRTEQARLEAQLALRQRLTALGTIASGIAHDFNNLLAIIQGHAETMSHQPEALSANHRQAIEGIVHACRRGADLTGRLATFTSPAEDDTASFDVARVAAESVKVLSETTNRVITKRVRGLTSDRFALGSESQIYHVLMNLGINAIQAIEQRGVRNGDEVVFEIGRYHAVQGDRTGLAPGRYVHVIVRDSGPGMPPDVREQAFDPWFATRTKGTRKGQGLGLAIVYDTVVRRHRGSVEIESDPGRGTAVHLYLPEGQAVQEQPRIPSTFARGAGETILVVDDEPQLRDLATRILTHAGYQVLTAADGLGAVEVFRDHEQEIAVIVLDRTMPGQSGEAVLAEMKRIAPHVPVIISSGDAALDLANFPGAAAVLHKPYGAAVLCKAVADAIGAAAPDSAGTPG